MFIVFGKGGQIKGCLACKYKFQGVKFTLVRKNPAATIKNHLAEEVSRSTGCCRRHRSPNKHRPARKLRQISSILQGGRVGLQPARWRKGGWAMSATQLYRSVREGVAFINAEEARAACLSVCLFQQAEQRFLEVNENNSVWTLCR